MTMQSRGPQQALPHPNQPQRQGFDMGDDFDQMGEPRRLPNYMERERQRQTGHMPPEEAEGEIALQSMYDFLWPAGFWIVTLFNATNLVAVGLGSIFSGQYDPWKHLQVVGISVATHALMTIVYKWIIRGPDGLPTLRQQR